MYITCLAASPCAKIVVFLGKSTTFLATPAESRKLWASKAPGEAAPDLRVNAGFAMICGIHLNTLENVRQQNANVSTNGQISTSDSSNMPFVGEERLKPVDPQASA
jgi:hypothetical protein